MQILVIVGFALLVLAMIPFTGAGENPYRERAGMVADVETGQLEAFARAAWFAARAGATGTIDEKSIILPLGFTDDPAYPFHAYVEGSYLYVWGGKPQLERTELIFSDGDYSVDVGSSTASSLTFRDGETVPRPNWLPSNIIIVRLRV